MQTQVGASRILLRAVITFKIISYFDADKLKLRLMNGAVGICGRGGRLWYLVLWNFGGMRKQLILFINETRNRYISLSVLTNRHLPPNCPESVHQWIPEQWAVRAQILDVGFNFK